MSRNISSRVIEQLAPNGTLRAGINMSNPLLVTGKTPDGMPVGLSPDMAAAVAAALGVRCELVPFPRPGDTADAVEKCGIVNIAVEPERAKTIAFSPAYAEIQATYLVPPGSSLKTIEEVDRPGIRIVVSSRSAYDLYLSRTLSHATLVRINGIDLSFEHFKEGGFEVLAGLRPALLTHSGLFPGSRILDGGFTTVGQAVGTARKNEEGAAFLHDFVEEAKASGLVANSIARHGVQGLNVGRPQPRG